MSNHTIVVTGITDIRGFRGIDLSGPFIKLKRGDKVVWEAPFGNPGEFFLDFDKGTESPFDDSGPISLPTQVQVRTDADFKVYCYSVNWKKGNVKLDPYIEVTSP